MWIKVYKWDDFHFCSKKKIANQFPIINYDPKIPSVEILVFWSFRSREKQSVLGPPVYAARQHHTMCATSQLHYWSCSLTNFWRFQLVKIVMTSWPTDLDSEFCLLSCLKLLFYNDKMTLIMKNYIFVKQCFSIYPIHSCTQLLEYICNKYRKNNLHGF